MMQLSQAAALMHGQLSGADRRFKQVVIDSRRIQRGDLFVAIQGARHDGHDFIAQANRNGAVGTLVSRASRRRSAQIKVADTTIAIGQLAAHWRKRFHGPLVAVTGSNGKTTVSALLAAMFNQVGNCLAPHGSFNNQWGVPLTLLRLRKAHTHAVIEMGMNRPGEIKYLSQITRPDIALINNVGAAHLAGFADLQGIADAKAEIFSGLTADGVAVLNADDHFCAHWERGLQRLGVHNIVRFSAQPLLKNSSIAVGAGCFSGNHFELNIKGRREQVCLPRPGKHNMANSAAAAAAAHAAGLNIAQISNGLQKGCASLPGRLDAFRGINSTLVLDDTYNANPVSMQAALDVLADFDGERIAVLGGMAELGARSDDLHVQVGAHARACGVQHLLCLGAAGDSGLSGYARGFGEAAECYADLDQLRRRLVRILQSRPARQIPQHQLDGDERWENGVAVLVKGSRVAAMERVVVGLRHCPPESGYLAARGGGESC